MKKLWFTKKTVVHEDSKVHKEIVYHGKMKD